ncbi:MAG TPA: FMN-binding protein [Micromonosporaceae bacterium]
MRRPTAAIVGTFLGAALLIGARLGTHPAGLDDVVAEQPLDEGGPGGAGSPSTGAPHGTPRPGVTTTPRPGATPGAGGGSSTATQTGPASTSTTTAAGATLRSGTFAGAAVTHKYGTLQVIITVSGGRITAIKETYKTSLRVSAQINADALPKLRQEALAAQSANIATVSGATYTSDAYRSSLRSALTKAAG